MEEVYVEKTVSRGIAVSPVYKYREPVLSPETGSITEEEIPGEKKKFEDARDRVLKGLSPLAAESEIFAAHLEIASDFMLQDSVNAKISECKNAQTAVKETTDELAAIFAAMDDTYMKEREADIRDIGRRLLAELKGIRHSDLGSLTEEVIVAAKDLYPSDTVKITPRFVKGIITEEGGITNHVSVIAKSMDIPILVGVKGIFDRLEEGKTICMDAENGVIVLDPDVTALEEYRKKKEEYKKEYLRVESLRNTPAVTKGGKRILLCANVGNIVDMKHALAMNIDGIGLFRSEFLYMENNHFPTEEEQYRVYKEAAELCPQGVTIRTLDIGGDKELSYFPFNKEDNPFLGWRAIRISLDMKDMFKTQLRAILRASAYGHVRIMFPMIISLEELREAKKVVEACKNELRRESVDFDTDIALGMMMETPASVFLAEEFAKEADFFSIGTNDLTQYILAADRGNEKIADKYDYFHPAVLKAVEQIICAGHRAGIQVGMCGEMAGDVQAVPVLLKLGLDEFSMSAGCIDYVREQILNV